MNTALCDELLQPFRVSSRVTLRRAELRKRFPFSVHLIEDINRTKVQTGLALTNKDNEGRVMGELAELPPITQFLNRLLSLKIDLQNAVFDAFSERLDAVIEARREAGLLDVGMETVRADKIEKASEQTVHTVEGSGAETKYVKLNVSKKFHPTEFDTVASNEWRKVVAWLESPNGKVYAAAEAPRLSTWQ